MPARVGRVSDADPGLLRHLEEIGVVPGVRLSVLSRDSGGVVRLSVSGRRRSIGKEAAQKVYVSAEPAS